MGESTRGSISIAAPASAIAAVLSDFASYPAWTQGMSEPAVLASDAEGRPSEATFVVNAGPVNEKVRLAYEWQPARVSWRLLEGASIVGMDGSYSWTSNGEGTRVEYELALELSISLPSLLRKMAEKAVITSALDGLKKRVEQVANG